MTLGALGSLRVMSHEVRVGSGQACGRREEEADTCRQVRLSPQGRGAVPSHTRERLKTLMLDGRPLGWAGSAVPRVKDR